MKKITFSFILLFVLTFTAFADGDIHTGGKSCPQNQTCLFHTEQTEPDSDIFIIKAVRNFLDLIF